MTIWFWIGVLFSALGLVIAGFGLRALVTGRNYKGRWGRGFSAADDARLARAPASYFRALGAVAACLGGTIADFAGLMIVAELHSSLWLPLAVVAALLLAGLVASLVVIVVLAARYRLTRFDAP